MHVASSSSNESVQATYAPGLQAFVFVLFFAFGGITSLNDVLIPKLRGLFTLSYGEVMLIQFAFFAAYFIISIPAAALVRRIGYMRSAVTGLLIMTAGCALFIPASSQGLFGLFLLALFVLAAGITTVQVVANPLISMLGKPATVSSRLTFAQAFNSLGTTIFPTVGSILILGSLAKVDPKSLSGAALDAFRTTETQVIVHTYVGLAIALAVIAAAVWWYRKALVEPPASHTPILRAFNLLTRPRIRIRNVVHLSVRRRRSGDWIAHRQLPHAAEYAGLGRRGRRQTHPVLLGRRHGRAFHRLLCAAAIFAGQGLGMRCRDRHCLADDFGQHLGRGISLVAAGDRLVQLHHVSDHLYARERRPRGAGGGRFRRDLHGDRGRGHRPAGHRQRG